MHIFWTALLGLIAFLWLLQTAQIARGIRLVPHLENIAPAKEPKLPKVSILVAARDEAPKLPEALASFLSQDYPDYEVVAVNDRSRDETQQILDAAAAAHPHLKVAHIETLPAGWLGKPHALQQAYEHASGEWLVFTDADVYFAPGVLRRSVALTLENNWDHLTLLGRAEMFRFFEKIAMTFFGFGFVIGTKPEIARLSGRGRIPNGAPQQL